MAMQRRLAWLAVAAGAVAMLPLGGCVALVAAGAGGGAVAYVENGGVANFYAFYPTSMSQVSAASRATFGEMGIRYNGEIRKGPSEYLIEGTTQDGQTAKVTLTSMATDVTKVNIRIGTFGDKPLSLQFQKLLSQRLGMAASAEAPAGGVPSSASSQPTVPQQPEQQTIPLQ